MSYNISYKRILFSNDQKKMLMRKSIPLLFAVSFLLNVNAACFAQDSTLLHSIEKEAHRIYDQTDKQDWFLTKEKVLEFADTTGTEITAYSFKNTINRIVCLGYNAEGQWAVEFYISKGKLIFIYYETSFFEKDTAISKFLNWKGYPSIEMRIYYQNNSIISFTSNGIENSKEVLRAGNNFPPELEKLIRWINRKI